MRTMIETVRGRGVRGWFGGGIALALLAAPTLAAQQTADFVPEAARGQDFELSIRNIMRGPEHVGSAPSGMRFSDDGDWIYFSWKPGGEEWDAPSRRYRVRSSGGEPELVEDTDDLSIVWTTTPGDISFDGRRKLITADGDLWEVDLRSGAGTRLTETQQNENSARYTPSGGILYRSGSNLFLMESGRIRQLTDIRSGDAPRPDAEPDDFDRFLQEQQIELFEHIRRQVEREEEERAEEEAEAAEVADPLYVPQGENVAFLDASPDGRHVLVASFVPARGTRRTMVPDWVTPSGFTEELTVRTKVGDDPSTQKLRLYHPETGNVIEMGGTPDDYEGESTFSVQPRGWNEAGTHALMRARSDDDTEWVLYAVDGATGERTLLDRLYDEAWVAGPCGFCHGWLPESNTVYYVSEESGYAHVYLVEADGTGKRALTSGEWEVLQLQLREDEERFFIRTNEGSPHNQHIGFLSFDGELEYLTEGEGRYSATLSRDGERIAITHDVANRPAELYVAETDDVEDRVQVTDTPTEEWKSFGWLQPEIVRFAADDGAMVPARIYRPEQVGGTSNGAAVIFVHGAGYLQNVHNWWSSYYREYMFHHLLAAQGYTVLDIDYRASAGYGSAWRTGIYRFMGGKDLSDQVDGAEWLVANEGIDPERIGIYGGSYGGFITLMALFTAEDTFKSGAALRSVTDWPHYNDGYTSNILNDPAEDPEAHRRSSPIYHAENFRDDQHLVMLHGLVDTNVQPSDVIRLAQRLIELGKENWELAVYPVEGHGFVEPTSWTDEYRRIFELFERTISRPGCTEGGAMCEVPGR